MEFSKIISGFLIFFALTLNFTYVYGEFNNFQHHSIFVLYATIIANIIATILKLGDHSRVGVLIFSTSLVALFQLLASAGIYFYITHTASGINNENIFNVISMAAGALIANFVSVVVLITDATKSRR